MLQESPKAIEPSTLRISSTANPTVPTSTVEPQELQPTPPAKRISQRLDPTKFPHPAKSLSQNPATTLENLEYLLEENGFSVRFDVIKKQLVFRQDGRPSSEIDLVSLANLNGLNASWLPTFLYQIGMENPLNPVEDWIDSMPWDGRDRLPQIYDTVQVAEGYPDGLKEALLKRWLLSAVAAATLKGKRFHSRGVLTFQGAQGIGKTSWICSLIPLGELRESVIKRDHHLDGANKDSILGAISHWLVEIGELDSSFKKDVARLKGFITNDCDKVRPPYGRRELEYDRRTVFAATVNDEQFLVDSTGNNRFWTIAVDSLDFKHTIDMQQLFAQLRQMLATDEQWWLTPEEDAILDDYNLQHRSISAVAEIVLDHLDLDADRSSAPYMTPTELLKAIGISRPSNPQTKECGTLLREKLGDPKRVQGRGKWRIPLKDGAKAYPPNHFVAKAPKVEVDKYG